MRPDILITGSVESSVVEWEPRKLLLCCPYKLMTVKEISLSGSGE